MKWIQEHQDGIVGLILLVALFFMCFAFSTRSQDRYWQKVDKWEDQKILYEMLRAYPDEKNPDTVMYILVGDSKSRLFHWFSSPCCLDISLGRLTGFNDMDEAEKAGYKSCPNCPKAETAVRERIRIDRAKAESHNK